MSLLLDQEYPVIVTADKADCVIGQSKNPEYGFVRVAQDKTITNEKTGFTKIVSVSALIQGTMEDLKKMNFTKGKKLKGNVLIKESLVPFNFANPDYDLKVAPSTGVPLTLKGQNIYRKTMYSQSTNGVDTLIQHDNVDELRAAYNQNQKEESIEEDFTL